MNRFVQGILIVFSLTTSAVCQERDSLAVAQDSTAFTQEPTVLVQDSTVLVQDTILKFEDIDSIYRAMDPDIYAARRLEAESQRTDSLTADSLMVDAPPKVKSPSKAIMYALVLPGLGQFYNGRYWKAPIVWAAVGVAGYAIVFNSNEYKAASSDYAQNPDDTNRRYLEFWRRNMELSYIAMIAIYALQILDAYVDAQLYNWDVNDNLSLRISPSLQPLMTPNSITGQSYGLTCSFNIRGR